MTSLPAAPQRVEFVKAISRLDATALVVGSMIGSGIFIVSADILRQVQSPGLLLMVWLLSGLVTLLGAVSYGELAAMFPKAGGNYVYLREGISPLFGYLYGWTLFVVIQTGTIAAVAVAFARFTSVLWPWLSPDVFLGTTIRFPDPIGAIDVGLSPQRIFAIASIALLTWINVRGVRTAPSGLGRDGSPGPGYSAPNDLTARVTALAEGTRGLPTGRPPGPPVAGPRTLCAHAPCGETGSSGHPPRGRSESDEAGQGGGRHVPHRGVGAGGHPLEGAGPAHVGAAGGYPVALSADLDGNRGREKLDYPFPGAHRHPHAPDQGPGQEGRVITTAAGRGSPGRPHCEGKTWLPSDNSP